MPDRTPHDTLLLEIAEAGTSGKLYPFASIAHAWLRDEGLIEIGDTRWTHEYVRVRCTAEGLDVAREIEGEGA